MISESPADCESVQQNNNLLVLVPTCCETKILRLIFAKDERFRSFKAKGFIVQDVEDVTDDVMFQFVFSYTAHRYQSIHQLCSVYRPSS